MHIHWCLICRPPENRDPTIDEQEACRFCWSEAIRIVVPKVIMGLGRWPMRALTQQTHSLREFREDFHEKNIWYMFNDIPIIPTYHPSYLMRGSIEDVANKVSAVTPDYLAAMKLAGMIK